MKHLKPYPSLNEASLLQDPNGKFIGWPEYCEELFAAPAEEVEKALKEDGFTDEEISGFKSATYLVIGRVYSPDINSGAVKALRKQASKFTLPDGAQWLDSEEYYNKPGSLVLAAVCCKGDGLEPYSINF